MSSSVVAFKNQNYAELKRDCIQRRKLFKDPEFPANDLSVFHKEQPRDVVKWKRPGEITSNPHLFVEGINSHDLNQGEVGNCWFVAASSCLALKPNIWEKVIPDWEEQDWDPKHPENYAGIFHFRFWVFGQWTDVVVDDRLPTVNGRLIYCHSNSHNEFWSALLEKAYAKLYGCYESLSGGYTGDAVVDFSGAVYEVINLDKEISDQDQINLFEKLRKVYKRGGIISCGITADRDQIEARLANGLVMGHAYAVTAVKRVHIGHGQGEHSRTEAIPMVRMRNPWGQKEWNGPWSDSSEEWAKIGDMERKNLGLTVEDDGEFWMSFEDWCKQFTDADVCRIINTSVISVHKTWNEVLHFGSWTKHGDPLLNRCGGCGNNKTFLQNPQYMFDVTKETDEVLITLQQKDRRILRKTGQGENLSIGFSILKVELNRKYRIHRLLSQKLMETSIFINSRSVFLRCNLPQGRYVIIPTTFQAGEPGEFMLRIFTDVDSGCRELTEDKPKVKCWTPLFGYPQVVTHVSVRNAEGLENQDQTGGADPYVIIYCEGKSVKSTIHKDTLNPEFDTSGVFYRKKPTKPITVEVWNSNAVKDEFMGQVVLSGSPKDTQNYQKLQLRKRGSNMADEMPGSIILCVVTESELTAI
uniref:Calpain 6 n=1 Tax=Oryzias melastigma TaxID=30732 RepID=A0A3B3CYW2_ORYME